MKTGEVVSDAWWRRLRGGVKYYIISTDSRSVAECKLSVFYLKDFDEEFTIAVSGVYRVRCEREAEEKVAKALHNGNHPGLVLERLIRDWVNEYSSDGLAAFVTKYFEDKRQLLKHLKEKARDEVGLTLDIKLQIDAEKSL